MTESLTPPLMAVRSLLFVSGAQPARFANALASGADVACIDLEDSVPHSGKDAARDSALAAIATDQHLALRINGLRTASGIADLAAIAASKQRPSLILVPMVDDVVEIEIVSSALDLGDAQIIPLIETVRGLRGVNEIAAHPAVFMMMFGGGDLASQLGVALHWDVLLHARCQFAMGCAEASKPAIDMPWIDLTDEKGLASEAAMAKAIGFRAKAAIHPAQIETIVREFAPSSSEIREARNAVEAFEAAGGAAVRHNGKMLEAPLMARYRSILAAAPGSDL